MATTYEQTTTTAASGPVMDIRPDVPYFFSIPGLLKAAEMLLDVLVLICASIEIAWIRYGGGWVQFVAAVSLMITFVFFILYFMRIVYRIAAPWAFIEFLCYAGMVFIYFIAAIVAASRAEYAASIGACCFFAFAALAVYAVDLFFKYRAWQTAQKPHTSEAGTAVTTTTSTTFETRTQY